MEEGLVDQRRAGTPGAPWDYPWPLSIVKGFNSGNYSSLSSQVQRKTPRKRFTSRSLSFFPQLSSNGRILSGYIFMELSALITMYCHTAPAELI